LELVAALAWYWVQIVRDWVLRFNAEAAGH
jgi:hypothetical protein